MEKQECWNCGEPIEEGWNYCIHCTSPVSSSHVLQELEKHITKKDNILENAPDLVAEGILDKYSKKEIQEILEKIDVEPD